MKSESKSEHEKKRFPSSNCNEKKQLTAKSIHEIINRGTTEVVDETLEKSGDQGESIVENQIEAMNTNLTNSEIGTNINENKLKDHTSDSKICSNLKRKELKKELKEAESGKAFQKKERKLKYEKKEKEQRHFCVEPGCADKMKRFALIQNLQAHIEKKHGTKKKKSKNTGPTKNPELRYCKICPKQLNSCLSLHLKNKHNILNMRVELAQNEKIAVKLDPLPEKCSEKPKMSHKQKVAHAIKQYGGRATVGEIQRFIKETFTYYSKKPIEVKRIACKVVSEYACFPGERELVAGKFVTTYRINGVEWKKDLERKKTGKKGRKQLQEINAKSDEEDDVEKMEIKEMAETDEEDMEIDEEPEIEEQEVFSKTMKKI